MMTLSATPAKASVVIAAGLFAMMAGSISATAENSLSANGYLQVAAQQQKAPTRGANPTQPKPGPMKVGIDKQVLHGCADGVTKTSSKSPCPDYSGHEGVVQGCHSFVEQASLPGPCPNSSEP